MVSDMLDATLAGTCAGITLPGSLTGLYEVTTFTDAGNLVSYCVLAEIALNGDPDNGTDDVDGGVCILESPVYAVTEDSDVSIWYFHGQSETGNDAGDFFLLEISTDGGTNYSTLVSIGDVETDAVWTEVTATVLAGSDVKLRVQVSDGTTDGNLIEGGVASAR